jgi:GTP-binding nuclear protein Ran
MWDCAGQEKFGGLREGYCLAAACAIVMFDVTSRISYENVDDYIKTINRVAGPFTPIAVVGNKVDIREGRKVKPSAEYIQYSVKSCYNFERPFLELARQLCKDPDLYFIAYDEQEEKY